MSDRVAGAMTECCPPERTICLLVTLSVVEGRHPEHTRLLKGVHQATSKVPSLFPIFHRCFRLLIINPGFTSFTDSGNSNLSNNFV